MRALVQRVAWAEVEVDGRIVGRIGRGLLVYVGVGSGDGEADARRLAEKLAHIRLFEDEAGKINLSVRDARGGVLVISNFTLMADTRKGRRPDFIAAARPEEANQLYELFAGELERLLSAEREDGQPGCTVARGVFRATMQVRSAADGPVNVLVDVPADALQRVGPS